MMGVATEEMKALVWVIFHRAKCLVAVCFDEGKGKGKFHPRKSHGSPEGE
jgi:hypothetical protein